MEPWYLERLRASTQLNGVTCPGEEICTTDRKRGKIAGTGRTLESFCHNFKSSEEDTEKQFLPVTIKREYPGCERYPTKPETLPLSLIAAVDTAEDLKESRKLGFIGPESLNTLTAWEVACYRVADRCSDIVQGETRQEQKAGAGVPENLKPAPGQSTKPTEAMDW